MSLKPIAPKGKRAKRPVRPMGAPVVVVQKKQSGSGGLIIGLVALVALGGGGFVYYNQQQNEAALAAKQARLDANAAAEAENARLKAEYEAKKAAEKEAKKTTALGAVAPPTPAAETAAPAAKSSGSAVAVASEPAVEEEEEEGTKSAMGSTSAPSKGDGVFNVQDTSPPPYDLTAQGKAAKKVMEQLDKAIDKASAQGRVFYDLQEDLKRSFQVAYPDLYANKDTLPAFPDKEQKLLRMAQGVYTCLNLATELEARNTIPSDQHGRFVNWLLKDKAKAARTFTYGVVEYCGIHDTAKAADLLDEVRQAYLISPTSGMKKIPEIIKAAKE